MGNPKVPTAVLRDGLRVALDRHGITDEGLFDELSRELMFSREQFAIEIYANAENPNDATKFRAEVVDILGSRREGAADYATAARIADLSQALATELRGVSLLRGKILEQQMPDKVEDLAQAIFRLSAAAQKVMADMGEPRRDSGDGRPTSLEGEESLRLFGILRERGIDSLRKCSRIVAEILKETGRSESAIDALRETLYQRFRNHLVNK